MVGSNRQFIASSRAIRLGFVPLLDAAPVILAFELGYFEAEGLDIQLSREIGWGNVRDKLAFGHLHASHALLGLPIQSLFGDGYAGERIISIMSLGTGGAAITLSERLFFSGVNSAASLMRYVRQSHGQIKPVLAHVFNCSMHHYLLREWLATGGLDPDEDVHLCVLPPPQMANHMASGHIDGFCAGDPWNTLAHRGRSGRIVAITNDIVPKHPEKILAVNQKWAASEQSILPRLVRAILKGCDFCGHSRNFPQIAAILGRPRYLNLDADTLLASLEIDRSFGVKPTVGNMRAQNWEMRCFTDTFPSVTHMAWLISQMIRWKHLGPTIDPWMAANQCVDTTAYRAAANSLDKKCPDNDTPPMQLRGGITLAQTTETVA